MTRRHMKLVFIAALAALLLLMLYPLGWLAARALADAGWSWTLANLREVAEVPRLREGLFNTFWVSFWVLLVSLPAGLGLAVLSVRARMPAKGLFRLLTISPFLCPPMIASIGWVILADSEGGLINILLRALGLGFRLDIHSFAGLVFVTSLLSIPLAFLILEGALRQLDGRLEDAARVCGADGAQVWLRVVLPLMLPALMAAGLLVFLQANICFGTHAPIGMPAGIPMLTTLIYTHSMVGPVDLGVAAALSLILVVIGLALLGAQGRLLSGRDYAVLGGSSRPARPARLGGWKYAALAAVGCYLLLAAFLPYGVLLLKSLKPLNLHVNMGLGEVFSGWGMSGYLALWDTGELRRAILNSFLLGLGAAAGCSAMAAVCGYLIFRARVRGRRLMHAVILMAPALSGVVVGVAFLFAFGGPPFGLYGTPWILLLAYMARELAVSLKALESPFRQIQPELEEAASVCGASWRAVLGRVVLPLSYPALAGGAALVFIAAFRELGASAILFSHGSEVVGSALLTLWHDGYYQELSALAVVSAVVCLATVFGVYMALVRKDVPAPG